MYLGRTITKTTTNLRSGSQMQMPEFGVSRNFGGTRQLIGTGTKKITAYHVSECPSPGTVFGDAYLELAAGILLVALACHVPERIHRQVLVQMGSQIDVACKTISISILQKIFKAPRKGIQANHRKEQL